VLGLLEATLSFLKREIRPDILIVTGDLVDVPFYAIERRDASILEHAKMDYLQIRKLLDASSINYLVLWGNHDDETTCREVFGIPALLSEFPTEVDTIIIKTFPFDREDPEHFPARDYQSYPHTSPGSGSIVHVQHYVVIPTLNETYPHTYRNAEEILERNIREGVTLSLSGHYHPGHPPMRFGPTTYAIGAAFCEEPFPFYVYELEDERRSTLAQVARGFISRSHIAEGVSCLTYSASTLFPLASARILPCAELPNRLPSIETSNIIMLMDSSCSEEECDRLWQQYGEKGIMLEGVCPTPSTSE